MQISTLRVASSIKTLRGIGSPTFSPRSGQARLEQFEILQLLGGGGMAEVFLARPVGGPTQPVVLKLLRRHLLEGQVYRDMFLDEIQVTTRLDHPHLVRIVEPGYSLVDWFLVLQPISGISLSRLLRKLAALNERGAMLSANACALIAGQIASGLGYVHAMRDENGNPMSIVHRDVSPKNIMISSSGEAKLIDFGITHLTGRAGSTRSGDVKGKLGYLAPEQVDQVEPVTHRTDIFALGVVLWEMLTGKRLFLRKTYLDSIRALMESRVPRPSRFARVPAFLDDVIMCALQPSPRDRFGDASQMAAALLNSPGTARDDAQRELIHKLRLVAYAEPVVSPAPGHGAPEPRPTSHRPNTFSAGFTGGHPAGNPEKAAGRPAGVPLPSRRPVNLPMPAHVRPRLSRLRSRDLVRLAVVALFLVAIAYRSFRPDQVAPRVAFVRNATSGAPAAAAPLSAPRLRSTVVEPLLGQNDGPPVRTKAAPPATSIAVPRGDAPPARPPRTPDPTRPDMRR